MNIDTPPLDIDALRQQIAAVPSEPWEVRNQHNWVNRYYIKAGDTVRLQLMAFDDRWLTAEDVSAQTLAYQQHVASLHNAIPAILTALSAAEARAERLREALAEFADPDSWWMADAVNVHGMPIKVKAWKFGTIPWDIARAAIAGQEEQTNG